MDANASVSLALPPHIHLAWCDADVVILDLQADQYGLLVDAAAVLAPGPLAGTVLVDPAVQADLEKLGLTGADFPPQPRTPLPDRRGELSGRPGSTSLGPLLAATLNTVASVATFHGRPLGRLVRSARGRRASSRRPTLKQIARATGAFQTLHPWVPFEGDCLQRGYRLHHHLHRQGIDARWVFGVRTWPFLAHCWVQVDDLVVGDSLDRVGGFTPILAV